MNASNVIPLAGRTQDDGLYFRVRYNDHSNLTRLLAERRLTADGLILDARSHQRHEALRREANRVAISTWLDTQAMELALPGTSSCGHAALPWAQGRRHRIEDFTAAYSAAFARKIAAQVTEGSYSAVLSPTHYVTEEGSAWLEVDAELTKRLRDRLDAAGAEGTPVIYPLALPGRLFYDAAFRAFVRTKLKTLPVRTVALRIHPFGSGAGPVVMRDFIEACDDLRPLNVPLLIERGGFAALAAYALGAADLVETGITYGDTFNVNALLKEPVTSPKTSFPLPKRVYLEALGMTVSLELARRLLSSSTGKYRFACKDAACCPNGPRDMLDNTERHSALARQRQFRELSRVPATMRADHFIGNMLAPVCDALSRAGDVHEPLKEAHRRLLSIKETLIALRRAQENPRPRPTSMSTGSVMSRPGSQILPFTPRQPRGR